MTDKRDIVQSAEDQVLAVLLKELTRLASSGKWLDETFFKLIHEDVAAHDAWLDAAYFLGDLDRDGVLAVRARWKDRYGLHFDVLDVLLITALRQSAQRAKEALKALKAAVNQEGTH